MKEDAEKATKGLFMRSWQSLRTQYAMLTAFILVLVLSAFYIGGRIVMAHLVRDTEVQIKEKVKTVQESVAERPNINYVVEALNYYSGGFWEVDSRSFDMALYRLAFFVALAGIGLVLFLFFVQNRLLLNPLTRMTDKMSQIGTSDLATDCPQLEWEGRDEFAVLASSINQMLETLSARSLSIAQAESRQQALIGCLPDSLAVFDISGRLVSVLKKSEKRLPMPGVANGEVPSVEVFGKASVGEFLRNLRETFATGKLTRTELVANKCDLDDGTQGKRYFELRLMRMDAHFALVIVRDTTKEHAEHERFQAAMARESDVKKRESLTGLAAGIAHDMNNVLSVVLNAAESEGVDPSGDSAKALDTIRDAVRRGTGMMNELRTYAGENRVTLKRVSAARIVNDIRLMAEQLVGRNIIVSLQTSNDAPDVDADSSQFWKVLFNLFKNAAEAIGPDRPGHIQIGCSRFEMTEVQALSFISEKHLPPGTGTIFTLRDDGPGIKPDILPRLFDPYVSSKSVGRGLGLATVRSIIEVHGGGIRVTSQPDVGTLFELYLPETKQTAVAPEEKVASAVSNSSDRNEVLIVDDERAILQTAAILIRRLKLVAHTAADAASALAIVRRQTTRLRAIILDADLGGTSTVRLLGTFRETVPGVPIIVSTGGAEDPIKRLFAPHPYDAYLAKPYTFKELAAVLNCPVA